MVTRTHTALVGVLDELARRALELNDESESRLTGSAADSVVPPSIAPLDDAILTGSVVVAAGLTGIPPRVWKIVPALRTI